LPKLLDRSEKIVRGGSLFAVGVGVLVVLGWLFGSAVLKSIVPTWPAMGFAAAIAFMLAGGAIFAWGRALAPKIAEAQRGPWEALARACAGALMVAGLLYAVSPGLFGLLAQRTDTPDRLRMAMSTAVSFAMLGIGLQLVKDYAYRVVFQSLFLGVMVIAALGISRYLYGGKIFPPEHEMAVHTGGTLLVLALAALHLRVDVGLIALAMDRGTAGKLMRRLLPAAIVIPLGFGWLRLKGQEAGWYGTETGLTLYALTNVLVFAALIWRNALYVQKVDGNRKRAELRLRASLREVVDLNTALDEHAIVAITGTDGRITFVNDKFCAISKFPREELLGQDHRIVNSGFHSKEFIRDLWAAIEAGKIWRADFKNRAKDGTFYWVSTIIMPFLDDAGTPLRYVAIGTDITGHKLAEEQIQSMNRELELRVQSRTEELESANKELEAFSYSVSHDLRSPLRAMNGFSEAVLEDYGPQLPEEGQRLLRTIRQNAQKMSHLIDDLLAFSRLSRAKLEKRRVPTEPLVRSVLDDLAMDRQNREVEIEIGALPESYGDPALLRQVWVNLLSNALKYSRQRAPAQIEIGGSVTDGTPGFYVRDNGTGFDPRYAHKLFGVFQRLHRAEDFEGTGVGLAIVQRIVHRHGGRVSAEAAVDKGATFSFTLEGESTL
jgi:PAS domain S-box-containing protein